MSRRLADHAGLELPAWVVETRTVARCAALGCDGAAYVELISGARGLGELGKLVEAVRVGESSLFRHLPQISTLTDVVVPELRAKRRRQLAVWSAGCSTGQEPYTLAIVLARALPDVQLAITATDVSDEALADARANRYPTAALADVPAAYHDAFEVHDDHVAVVPELARLVRFEKRNLIERGMRARFDLVWCRNVLIYFSVDARRRALDHLIDATADDGYLFVGYSESLRDVPEVEPVRRGEAVYYTRRGLVAAPRAARTATPLAGVPTSRVRTPPAGVPIVPRVLVADSRIVLKGTPDAAALTSELGARLAEHHARVIVELDGADVLDASLVPELRRAAAAARAAGGQLVLRATRASTRSWLERQGLALEDAP
ncbi:MAG: hypothetical protein NT062_14085 [Proteobacteria bacterium]|nr:hypothetical protein [Pseudomonadota bacterium]